MQSNRADQHARFNSTASNIQPHDQNKIISTTHTPVYLSKELSNTTDILNAKENDLEVKGSTIKSTNEHVSSRSILDGSSNDNTRKSRIVPPIPNEVNCNKKGRSGLTKSLLE